MFLKKIIKKGGEGPYIYFYKKIIKKIINVGSDHPIYFVKGLYRIPKIRIGN